MKPQEKNIDGYNVSFFFSYWDALYNVTVQDDVRNFYSSEFDDYYEAYHHYHSIDAITISDYIY